MGKLQFCCSVVLEKGTGHVQELDLGCLRQAVVRHTFRQLRPSPSRHIRIAPPGRSTLSCASRICSATSWCFSPGAALCGLLPLQGKPYTPAGKHLVQRRPNVHARKIRTACHTGLTADRCLLTCRVIISVVTTSTTTTLRTDTSRNAVALRRQVFHGLLITVRSSRRSRGWFA